MLNLNFNTIFFKENTSIQVGGFSKKFFSCTCVNDVFAVWTYICNNKEKYIILGGGCNSIFDDAEYDGVVIKFDLKGINKLDFKSYSEYYVASGEDFDKLAEKTVKDNFLQLSLLSGIPSLVGSAPIQNIGAYGMEISEVIDFVRCFDTFTGKIVELSNKHCEFSYRKSIFNSTQKGRYWILGVNIKLQKVAQIKLNHDDLIKKLHFESQSDPVLIRSTVLEIRRSKGMVYSKDTLPNCGSFFKNVVLNEIELGQLQEKIDKHISNYSYPMLNGLSKKQFKISVAKLIEIAGYSKGYRFGNVGISPYHSLCIVNYGNATFTELVNFADDIIRSVKEKFDIQIEIEPEIIYF